MALRGGEKAGIFWVLPTGGSTREICLAWIPYDFRYGMAKRPQIWELSEERTIILSWSTINNYYFQVLHITRKVSRFYSCLNLPTLFSVQNIFIFSTFVGWVTIEACKGPGCDPELYATVTDYLEKNSSGFLWAASVSLRVTVAPIELKSWKQSLAV